MAGEVFISVDYGTRFYYDNTQTIPFRVESSPMESAWEKFDNIHLFTLEQPKPRIERRWKYRRDYIDYTEESQCYYSEKKVKNYFLKDWYKLEDCFIDVEIKD